MHLRVRDSHTLDEAEQAEDLGQTLLADLLMLSFSDADLGALSGAWQATPDPPTLRGEPGAAASSDVRWTCTWSKSSPVRAA